MATHALTGFRLTYSERIHHARDNDGNYPFAVVGYRVLAVGAARGKALVILIREKASADSKAGPAVRYRRTTAEPVLDSARNQAFGQLFRAHAPASARARGQANSSPDSDSHAHSDSDSHADGKGFRSGRV